MGRRNATAVAPADDWQARDDFDTLMRAHQITNDTKRHGAAKAHAKGRLAAMRNVAGDDDEGNQKRKGSAQAGHRN